MQEFIQEISTSLLHAQIRPCLTSYDSGEEFSFYHWLEVCQLIDEADLPPVEGGERFAGELEREMRGTLLEVESSAAN